MRTWKATSKLAEDEDEEDLRIGIRRLRCETSSDLTSTVLRGDYQRFERLGRHQIDLLPLSSIN